MSNSDSDWVSFSPDYDEKSSLNEYDFESCNNIFTEEEQKELQMKYTRVPGDGNCLFHSLAEILQSLGDGYDQYTHDYLRNALACKFLDIPDYPLNNLLPSIIDYMKLDRTSGIKKLKEEINQKSELIQEYVWNGPLLERMKILLYNLYKTNAYYGDDVILSFCTKYMNLKFIIFSIKDPHRCEILFSPSNYIHPNKENDDDVFGFLHLNNNHYTPIKVKGKFLYLWKDVPQIIKDKLQPTNQPTNISADNQRTTNEQPTNNP